MKYETNTLPRGDSAVKIIDSQGSVTLVYTFRYHLYIKTRVFNKRNTITFLCVEKILIFGQAVANSYGALTIWSFDKSVCIVLNQLWLYPKNSQNQRLVIHGSG